MIRPRSRQYPWDHALPQIPWLSQTFAAPELHNEIAQAGPLSQCFLPNSHHSMFMLIVPLIVILVAHLPSESSHFENAKPLIRSTRRGLTIWQELDNWNILSEKAIAGIMSRASDEHQEVESKPTLWPTRRLMAPGMLRVALLSRIAGTELFPTIPTYHR